MNRLRIYYFLLVIALLGNSNVLHAISSLDSLMEKLHSNSLPDSVKANLYFDISNEYFRISNFVSALSYADKAEKIYSENDLQSKVAETLLFKGDIFTEVNDYENSIESLKKSQEYFENNGDSINYYHTLVRLASVNARIGNFSKSKILISTSLKYFKQKEDLPMLEEIYYQYAIVYGLLNNLDSALLFLQKSKQILTNSSNVDYSELGGIYNNIGAIYSKMNDFKRAYQSYREAIEVFTKIENSKGIGVGLSNLAFLYHKFDSLDLAEQYYKESSEILQNEGDIFYLSTIYSNWSDLYKVKGDYKNAYEMQMKYMAFEDSISGVEVMTRIAEMEKQFELNKKNQELEYLEKENRIKRNRQYLLFAIIILMIVVAFLIYRNLRVNVKNSSLKAQILNNEKKLLKEELDYKGKEVEDLALRIIEKNKFLETLKDEVGKIDGVGENKEKIKNVSSHIRENLYIDQDRKDFELQLDEIHKSFLFKLDKAYPNLTKTEKRLATLLVMDMTTKDIASILNLSIAGVKTSRYRLRKKIDLESKIDLATHFQGM